MATFLSAVTATTLQFRLGSTTHTAHHSTFTIRPSISSYQNQQTRAEQAVNLLWLSSLVFSIASATNSQLAYYLDLAHFRTPESRVARWALICITRTPVIYIIAAIVTFSAGLVGFTFTTFPSHRFIPIVIATLTSSIIFTLCVVIISFAGERYRLWTIAWNVSYSEFVEV